LKFIHYLFLCVKICCYIIYTIIESEQRSLLKLYLICFFIASLFRKIQTNYRCEDMFLGYAEYMQKKTAVRKELPSEN
jgi:hypothetical protein